MHLAENKYFIFCFHLITFSFLIQLGKHIYTKPPEQGSLKELDVKNIIAVYYKYGTFFYELQKAAFAFIEFSAIFFYVKKIL